MSGKTSDEWKTLLSNNYIAYLMALLDQLPAITTNRYLNCLENYEMKTCKIPIKLANIFKV